MINYSLYKLFFSTADHTFPISNLADALYPFLISTPGTLNGREDETAFPMLTIWLPYRRQPSQCKDSKPPPLTPQCLEAEAIDIYVLLHAMANNNEKKVRNLSAMHLIILILFPFPILGKHILGPRQSVVYQDKHDSCNAIHGILQYIESEGVQGPHTAGYHNTLHRFLQNRFDYVFKPHSVHKRHNVHNVPHHHGDLEVDFATSEMVRPFGKMLPLLYNIAVIGGMIYPLPYTTNMRPEQFYSDKYINYDAQLPHHILNNSIYRPAYKRKMKQRPQRMVSLKPLP
ncbi:unnamed protein product [Meganyctiphanes norvegica]|uniref:Uncharacterized protein n=1 Tax=Meganyctiphanes norvegica TaxID=48144 RepID=A0AAV2QZT3_MEGNR